jgi:hypothetical protein
MNKPFLTFLGITATFSLFGCQASPEQALVGNWIVDADRVTLPSGGALQGMEDRIKQGLSQFSLKLNGDKTFQLFQPAAIGGKVEGTWELKDGTVNLKGDKNENINLKHDPQANTLTFEQDMVFGKFTLPLYKTG